MQIHVGNINNPELTYEKRLAKHWASEHKVDSCLHMQLRKAQFIAIDCFSLIFLFTFLVLAVLKEKKKKKRWDWMNMSNISVSVFLYLYSEPSGKVVSIK